MPILFEFLLCGFPPFLPVIRNDIGHQDLLNLLHRRTPVVAQQHQFDQLQMMQCGHLTKPLEIGKFLSQNMRGLNRFE